MREITVNRAIAAIVALLLTCGLAVPVNGADSAEEDLAEQYPSSVEGRALDVETYRGPEWVARSDPDDPGGALVIERTDQLVASLGKDLDDLTIGTALDTTGGGGVSTITAVRVRGAAAGDFFEAAVDLMLGNIKSPRFIATSAPGKAILRVTDESMPGDYQVTVYPAGDTVWLVTADSQHLLEEIVAALPPAPPARPSTTPTIDLAEAFPSGVGGQPWPSEPVIRSGSDVILALTPVHWSRTDMLDHGIEAFLATGARLDDLTVAYTWGDLGKEGDTYAFLGAYQIAGADEGVMREDLIGIFIPQLARMAGVDDQAGSPIDELLDTTTVAGREVVRFGLPDQSDDASESIHFYVSGDTIWAIYARARSTLTAMLEQLPTG